MHVLSKHVFVIVCTNASLSLNSLNGHTDMLLTVSPMINKSTIYQLMLNHLSGAVSLEYYGLPRCTMISASKCKALLSSGKFHALLFYLDQLTQKIYLPLMLMTMFGMMLDWMIVKMVLFHPGLGVKMFVQGSNTCYYVTAVLKKRAV
jgi:hypothetical protein